MVFSLLLLLHRPGLSLLVSLVLAQPARDALGRRGRMVRVILQNAGCPHAVGVLNELLLSRVGIWMSKIGNHHPRPEEKETRRVRDNDSSTARTPQCEEEINTQKKNGGGWREPNEVSAGKGGSCTMESHRSNV